MIKSIKNANKIFVKMGELNENQLNNLILKRYGNDMVKTGTCYDEDHYKVDDFQSETTIVEVKARNLYKRSYDTTMIGYNKIKNYQNKIKEGKRCFVIFLFLDGCFEWEYTEENYEKNGGYGMVKQHKVNYFNENYTTHNEKKLHLYIKIEYLEKISSIKTIIPNGMVKSKKPAPIGKCLLTFKFSG